MERKLLNQKKYVASDYDDFYIATREEAEEQIETAKELVSRVEEYVQARWKRKSEK